METSEKKHTGSCHCGAVRFEVEADLSQGVNRCNCSICTKINPLGVMVKPGKFRLLSPEGDLGVYEWGAKISRRFFCKKCGVHTHSQGHLAEVGGDFVGVNANSLDGIELTDLKIIHWDGRHNNWDAGPRATPWPTLP